MAGVGPMGMGAEANTAEAAYKQFREFLISYNKLTELCYDDCVNDFTTRKVLDSEQSCTNNCMEKYLKMTQRISQRFQEYQTMLNEAGIGQAQKPS